MTSTREKRLIINEAEAEIVRKIFESFDEGKSSLDIADLLNSQGIPSPYSSRIRESMEQRKAKGLPEKEYARISEPDSLRWRPSTINRMIKNEIYIGKRNYTFYEPDPSNPKVAKARENRKTLTEFTVFEESLRIVEEALFYRVNEMMAQKRFNRNLGLKHDKRVMETTSIIERAKADILSLQKKINAFNKMKTKANIIAR